MTKKINAFDGTPADKREDRINAKKHHMTVKQWQGSPGDRKADAAGLKKMDAAKKKPRFNSPGYGRIK